MICALLIRETFTVSTLLLEFGGGDVTAMAQSSLVPIQAIGLSSGLPTEQGSYASIKLQAKWFGNLTAKRTFVLADRVPMVFSSSLQASMECMRCSERAPRNRGFLRALGKLRVLSSTRKDAFSPAPPTVGSTRSTRARANYYGPLKPKTKYFFHPLSSSRI